MRLRGRLPAGSKPAGQKSKGQKSDLSLRKLLAAGVCLLIAVPCLLSGNILRENAVDLNCNITFISKDSCFDASQLIQMMNDSMQSDETEENAEDDSDSEPEEEGYEFAAWKFQRNQQITADEAGRSIQVSATEVFGSTRCLLPYGNALFEEDKDKCIIGREISEELFGSHEAEGQSIVYCGRMLTVLDVVDEPSRLFMAEAEDVETMTDLNRINIMYSGRSSRKRTSEDFLNRYGVSADVIRYDYYSETSWFSDMLPGRWSDTAGWSENIKNVNEHLDRTKTVEKSDIESFYFDTVTRSYIFLGVGAVFLAASIVLLFSSFTKKRLPPPGLSATPISPL